VFKDIDKQKIKISNSKKNTQYYLPNIISMDPIDKLLEATKWLVEEAYRDWKETNELVEKRRKERGASKENIDEMKSFSIRLGSRTQGYINQLCLVEDILIFEYKRMNDLLKEASSIKLFLDPEEDYKELKNRLKPIRTFRNKVVAHTAYTKPWQEDNPETIVRSILNLFPESAKVTIGDNFFNGFSKYQSQLPVITIFAWHEEVEPIFKDWKKLYLDKLDSIHKQLPLKNNEYRIETAYPHLVLRQ